MVENEMRGETPLESVISVFVTIVNWPVSSVYSPI